MPSIGVGSEITVRIVEVETVDPPTKREPVKDEGDTEEESQVE